MADCIDHLHFAGKVCEDCNLPVDLYGNTEGQFDYCSYPDCGCDGARLCDAKSGASERAGRYNVEGMYRTKNGQARMRALIDIMDNKAPFSPASEGE